MMSFKTHSFSLVKATMLIFILSTACSEDPYLVPIKGGLPDTGLKDGQLDGSTNDLDAQINDSEILDATGGDADACVITNEGEEICDNLDNDCNGTVDDVDPEQLISDSEHCGKCHNACVFINAYAKCVDSKCELDTCAPGYYDANSDIQDGCEYQCLVSNQGTEICDNADNDCNGTVDDGFDLQNDINNCGSCGRRCFYNHGTPQCNQGQCALESCDTGFADNNKNDADGCEYQCPVMPPTAEVCNQKDDDCDGVIDPPGMSGTGTPCDTGELGECKDGTTECTSEGKIECVPSASSSTEICDKKDNDCNGVVDDGFDLNTNVLHCGDCNQPCQIDNAVPKCVGGVCQIDHCLNGFKDLDANVDGCEHQCEVWPTTLEKCNKLDDDCDGQTDEDFNLQTDVNHCGQCNKKCTFDNAVATCQNSTCILQSCNADYYDLDPNVNGCEYYCLKTGAEVCDEADNDCDGQTDEGFDKQTDVNNCGKCKNICQFSNAAASCNNGTCIQGACHTGYKDLDPNVAGCEYKCPVWTPTTDEASASTRCDGVDNDCDGNTDEDFQTTSCGIDTGLCKAGTLTCKNGVESCENSQGPTAEICDGYDNDCDGQSDEDFDKLNDIRYCENCAGCSIQNAIPQCVAGRCEILVCKQGYVDNDPNIPGCEYECTVSGPEICDGIDNDCDGQIDEGLTAPTNACRTQGACAGATISCEGTDGWVCHYGSNVDTRQCDDDGDCIAVNCDLSSHTCPGELPDEERRCDNIDNDCDGVADEPFTNKGETCSELGKTGICQGSGTFVCSGDHTTTTCNITTPGQNPTNEQCNGLDDDCDGRVDEAEDDGGYLGVKDQMIHINRSGHDFYIYRYEASKPGATSTSAGAFTHRACSRANVLPWTNISRSAAEQACQNIQPACGGSGQPPCWRLCTATEWLYACQGSSGYTWPYGDSFQASTCNGEENDSNNNSSDGDQDFLLPTGAKTSCISEDGAYDMSGNAREWTSEARSDGNPPDPDGYTVRGGAYDTTANGQKCGFTFAIFPNDFAYNNLGFRCCRDYQ